MSDKIKAYEGSNVDALRRFSEDVLEIWKDKKSIWEHFGKPIGLSESEFTFFMALGVALKANPFAREIWAVKYDKAKPAQIFLGRDFYRKKAQEQPDYNGHQAMAVFEKDTFKYSLGSDPVHDFDVTKDRGKLVGAYCMARKKGIDNPFFVYVSMEEAGKGQSTWKSMPVTMMEKVPEARCLRMAWQGVFKGTYAEDEQPIIEHGIKIQAGRKELQGQTEGLDNLTDNLTKDITVIDNTPKDQLNDAAFKFKERMYKIYQTDGKPDEGIIIEELMRFSDDGKGKTINLFHELSPARAKSSHLKMEKERFENQLTVEIPDEKDRSDYLREITRYDDMDGIGSVQDFKSLESIYMIKGIFKTDNTKNEIDKKIVAYRDYVKKQYGEEGG